MILSNFMRKNVKRRAKVGLPSPPHQSVSPPVFSPPPEQVFDIHEKAVESRVIQDSVSEGDTFIDGHSSSSSSTRLNTGNPSSSPCVQLDYTPEPLEDWFPQELLNGARNSKWGLDISVAPEGEVSDRVAPFQHGKRASMSHSRRLPSDLLESGAPRKSIPAPIFIPDVEGAPSVAPAGEPAVRVAAATPPDPRAPQRTSPPSPIPSENMSAVSGATIARALIGNSFVLSSTDRGSRYRSGIARQDSATLPRGDHPITSSPYLHDRRISGTETVDSTHDSLKPPVPPLPPTAGVRLPDQAKTSAVQEKLPSSSFISTASMENLVSGVQHAFPDVIMHSGLSRRISRISEAPSPVPTTPMSSQSIRDAQPMKSGSSLGTSVFTRMDETESDVPVTTSHTPTTGSSYQSFHQTGTDKSMSSVPSAGLPLSSSTDRSLDEYAFVSPEPLQTVTSSGSDSSVFVSHLQSKHSDVSLRRRRTRVLGATPSLTGGRSFKAGVLSDRTGVFQRNKKQITLPIGDRPRSILVPQTPITPALIASATVQHPSILSQFPLVPSSAVPVDHLELPMTALPDMDILTTAPLGILAARQRTFRIPTVVQEYDFLDYAITVTPNSQNSSNFPSSGPSAVEQTFPETPNIFTPLFTPSYPASEQGSLSPPECHQAPRSTTLPVPNDKCTLSRTKTLDILTKGDSSFGHRRPVSAGFPTKSVSLQEDVPLETVSDVATASLPPVIGQKTGSAVTLSVSLADRIDPVVSALYHLSMSSDKLQEEEALKSLAPHSASSISPITTPDEFIPTPPTSSSLVEQPRLSPKSVPLPESLSTSPHFPFMRSGSASPRPALSDSPDPNLQSFSPDLQPSPLTQSPNLDSHLQLQATSPASGNLLQRPESGTHVAGTSFLPSISSPPPSAPATPPLPSPTGSSTFTPSFVAPPPYHSVVSKKSNSSLATSTSGDPSGVNAIDHQPSISVTNGSPDSRIRVRARPPLPIGPRKPSSPGQPLGSFVPGIRDRNGSISSVGSGYGSNYPWRKLSAAASSPPPKFQAPPQKRRGMTMEAAQWTLKQHELQTIVSRAIKQSAEASSIRLLKLETLDVDIPEEVHRLEMQRTDVKSRYKMLVRKRWQLMGTLAGHLNGPDLSDRAAAARTVEEVSEVSLALDQLADELHNIVEQLGQLKSLRDVHSASALAMALRKINTNYLKQVAESQRLREQMEAMEAERDEAWKQAFLVAQDFDNLTDQVYEHRGSRSEGTSTSKPLNRRSTQVSAVRRSSIRQSKAGLRSVSRTRSRRSSVSSSGTRTSLIMSPSTASEGIPPVPPLPLHGSLGIVTSNLPGRNSLASNTSFSDAHAMQQVQRELYEMLGLTLQETPSEPSPRPRSVSGMFGSRRISLGARPMSDIIAIRPLTRQNRAIHSVLYDDMRLSAQG